MEKTARPHRHALKWALGAIAAVLVLVVGALALKSTWIAERLRGELESIATRSLGRQVSVGKLETHWFPKPGATVTNLRVEGAANEPPFLEASRATASVQLWPLVRSLGKDVRVGALKLNETKLNLVRHKDGTWNYESLGGPPKPSPAPSQGGAPSGRETLIEDLEIRDGIVNVLDQQATGGNAIVALRDIDVTLKGLGPGRALKGSLKTALAAPKQNVAVDFKVDPLPAGKIQPGQPWPQVTMRLRGKDLSVNAFRDFLPPKAANYFTGGQVDVNADVKTEQGMYTLVGQGAAKALKLRGEPASGEFTFASRVDPAHAKATKVDFTRISLKGPGIDLAGSTSVSMAPMRVRFAFQGQELDLGHLLGALPPSQPQTQEATPSTALPASVRTGLAKVDVGGTIKFAKVHHGTLEATNVNAQAKLDDGVLLLQHGSATVYGGHADLSGTRVDLTKKQPEWSLKMALNGMDTAQAFQALSGHPSLKGKASGQLQLTGTGVDWDQTRNTITGDGNVQLRDGALTTASLGDKVTPVLTQGLTTLGHKGTAGAVAKTAQGTQLKDLNAQFRVQGGWVSFTKPMAFESDIGSGTVDGRVGLDERLDLKGTLNASAAFVSGITHGVVPIKAPVAIPLTITGTIGAPEVKPGSPLNITQGLLPKVGDNPVNQARKGLGDLFKRPKPQK